jgi:hypothetical protein
MFQTADLFGFVAPAIQPGAKAKASAKAKPFIIDINAKAPIPAAVRAQLKRDAQNVRACAERKGLSMDHWEEMDEAEHAKNHFELGCWLYFYQRSFYDLSKDSINERVQCMLRLFLNGFTNPGYRFYTVFDFGERQFDSIMEMGDSERVMAEMQKALPLDKTGKIAAAFSYYGWSTN